jgi:hypothetical protein
MTLPKMFPFTRSFTKPTDPRTSPPAAAAIADREVNVGASSMIVPEIVVKLVRWRDGTIFQHRVLEFLWKVQWRHGNPDGKAGYKMKVLSPMLPDSLLGRPAGFNRRRFPLELRQLAVGGLDFYWDLRSWCWCSRRRVSLGHLLCHGCISTTKSSVASVECV